MGGIRFYTKIETDGRQTLTYRGAGRCYSSKTCEFGLPKS